MRRLRGELGDLVVMVTGYNDPGTSFGPAVDAVMVEARAQGIGKVMWLTMRTADGAYVAPTFQSNTYTFRDNNRILLQKAQQYGGRLQIADWAIYSSGQSTWVTSDGVHLQAAGAFAINEFIVERAGRVLAGETITPPPPAAWDPTAWVTVRRGDRGTQVAIGAAVRLYQSNRGLPATGAVDLATAQAMGLVAAPATARVAATATAAPVTPAADTTTTAPPAPTTTAAPATTATPTETTPEAPTESTAAATTEAASEPTTEATSAPTSEATSVTTAAEVAVAPGGHVWLDDGDGRRAGDERPVVGVEVRLVDATGTVATTVTDGAGHFEFIGFDGDDRWIDVTVHDIADVVARQQGDDATVDSDATGALVDGVALARTALLAEIADVAHVGVGLTRAPPVAG